MWTHSVCCTALAICCHLHDQQNEGQTCCSSPESDCTDKSPIAIQLCQLPYTALKPVPWGSCLACYAWNVGRCTCFYCHIWYVYAKCQGERQTNQYQCITVGADLLSAPGHDQKITSGRKWKLVDIDCAEDRSTLSWVVPSCNGLPQEWKKELVTTWSNHQHCCSCRLYTGSS